MHISINNTRHLHSIRLRWIPHTWLSTHLHGVRLLYLSYCHCSHLLSLSVERPGLIWLVS